MHGRDLLRYGQRSVNRIDKGLLLALLKRKVGGVSSVRFLDANGIYGTDGEYLLNILTERIGQLGTGINRQAGAVQEREVHLHLTARYDYILMIHVLYYSKDVTKKVVTNASRNVALGRMRIVIAKARLFTKLPSLASKVTSISLASPRDKRG